tara:strand:- start:80 stop:496 length:417 start_codon:yes stop_codon:yes gene_type:complete
MELFNIYWNDGFGNTDLIATTNNVDRWLEENNERRIADGNEPESLDDFEIEEANAYIYDQPIYDIPLYVMHYDDDDIGLDFECVTTDVDAYLDEYNEQRGFEPDHINRNFFEIETTYVQRGMSKDRKAEWMKEIDEDV